MPVLVLATLSTSHAKTNYAYTANYSSNNVSVINTSNNTVVKTIPVGSFPWGVAVDQPGKFAYVTNIESNSVSVISTHSNTVVSTITVGSLPLGVALSPNGKTAYVANGGSASVSVINTGTKKVTATIPVQTTPTGLSVTPNGAFLYVANAGSGTISVIATVTNKVVATVPTGTSVSFVPISPDGSTAYAINYGSNTVSVIRTADNTVLNTINVSGGPYGSAISPDGHWLYVALDGGGSGNSVVVIDTTTQTIATTIVVGSVPFGVAFSQNSALAYVTNINSNNVSVIDTASKVVVDTIAVGTGPHSPAVMGTAKVSTVAGGYVGDHGPATSAALGFPSSTVQDKAGNYYVSGGYRIRKITPAGTITTIAGTGICGYNGDNIPATKAMLCGSHGLALDSAGNLYVADPGNARVRKISASGIITTVAGTGVLGYSGDGGPAINATLRFPLDIAFDNAGNLYFSENGNHIVRKVDTSGIISTYAGTGVAGFSGDGGPATAAMMNFPRGIGFDSLGNLYIGDTVNHRVRIVSSGGTINTFAGNGNFGCKGDGGPALSASISSPYGIAVHTGVLYIDGSCSRVRTVDLATNIITTFAGSVTGYDGDHNPPLSSRFFNPIETFFDAAGNLLIDDNLNGRVRTLGGGLVTTFAGGYLGDGNPATSAALFVPEALAIDKSNNLYIADWSGHRIRKVSAGKITTIAGTGVNGYSGDGGPAVNAMLNFPQGVAVDSTGNVFLSDEFNDVVRKVDTSGKISTFANDPNFCDLAQMAIDSANNLYVADDCTSVIFKITPRGIVTIVAGVPFSYGYNGDGILATNAQLNSPYGLAVDKTGNILIADTYNSRLRLVDTSGIIHTIAGDGNCNYSGDGGLATSAELCNAWSVAVSGSGTIYFSDINYGRVRAISGGIITAFAGTGYGPAINGFNGDGFWPLYTMFDDPIGVAVDSKNAVYVLDDSDERVRKIQ